MQKFKSILKQDMSARWFWALVICLTAAKAVLGWQQEVNIWVGGAPLDDELMYQAAQSISAGEWLGAYNWLTLSKQMFFAVWLAFCHAVHVPYLMAGQLALCGVSLCMAMAFAPVLKRNKSRFALFAALALSPAAAATFTLRVYRDNIFPSECILFFAGIIGVALRCKGSLKHYWPWLAAAGIGFGLAMITREDGIWLMPFAVLGTAILLVTIVREKGLAHKPARCLLLAVPYVILAACVGAMAGMNYAYYGVFTTSDFSEGAFADAYGAMTRVVHAEKDSLVPVPQDVRMQLYEISPELAQLKPYLEEKGPVRNGYWSEKHEDYLAGSFYWVLRRSAQEEDVYASAQTAADYWAAVADAINAAIADGTLKTDAGPRSSTTPIIRAAHVLPTIAEAAHSFIYCATFQDCACYRNTADGLSIATAEDAENYRAYLGNAANYAAIENSDMPYYAPRQLVIYACFGWLQPVYAVLLPVLLLIALILQIWKLTDMIRRKNAEGLLLWLVLLGVFGMALLRCAMIAFMEVAAFQIGTYVMYLATVHPLLITYAVVGTITALPQALEARNVRRTASKGTDKGETA